jgi:hypothetical protein
MMFTKPSRIAEWVTLYPFEVDIGGFQGDVLSYGAWRHAQTLSLPMWRKLLLIFANCRDTNPQFSATVVSLGFANMNKSIDVRKL